LHAITGVCTPACLLAASISVEAVTPPLVGIGLLKIYFYSRREVTRSQLTMGRLSLPAFSNSLIARYQE
jgi:hypothetical protein